MSHDPRRILLVRLSHFGDVVHALPVFHALRTGFPRAEIAWAVQPEFAGIIEGLPGLTRVLAFERRGGARAWPRLWREIERFAPEWTIDAQGNVKSALVTLGSRAPRRSGCHRADWTEPFAASVLTDEAEPAQAPAGSPAHAMDRMIALGRHVAPGVSSMRRDPALTELELAQGEAAASRFFGAAHGRPAIVHVSAPGDVRSWPAEHVESLARELSRTRRVLVVSGPAEEDVGRAIAHRLEAAPAIAHWPGQRGPRLLAALFTAIAARDGVYIGCDSGPMHLAAACGLRVLALSGPQDARRTGPWPVPGGLEHKSHAVVRAEIEPECAPCLARTCSHRAGPVCMSGLRVEAVLDALDRLENLSRSAAPRAP